MSVLFVVFIPVETNLIESDEIIERKSEAVTPTCESIDDTKCEKTNIISDVAETVKDLDEGISPNDLKTPLLEKDENKSKEKKEQESTLDDSVNAHTHLVLASIEDKPESDTVVPKETNTVSVVGDLNTTNNKSDKSDSKVLFQQSSKVEEESEYVTLEQALQNLLGHLLDIRTDVWNKSDDHNHWQVNFVIEKDDVEFVLTKLRNFGIGSISNTSVSIFPATYHASAGENFPDVNGLTKRNIVKGNQEERSEFIKSVKSRLTVAQVVEAVKANSILTFDYVMLIVLAGIISAIGLVENSSVVLVASMLVSPLMGPILGGTFGLVVRNGALGKLGIKNEIIGLLLCILIGFLFGLVVSLINMNGASWGGNGVWPTSEMQSRGLMRSLWVGILIALPSGAGVAMSILGGNTGSLVGVAISASLLPPAVNAGMLWACSVISAIHPPQFMEPIEEINVNSFTTETILINTSVPAITNITPTSVPAECGSLVNNGYHFVYTCNMGSEAFILGIVSLTLTLLNIICIFLMGMAVLKIKEVAPDTDVSACIKKFWNCDMKVARETYKTMKTTDPKHSGLALVARQIAQEEKEKESALMPAIMEELEDDEDLKNVMSNLPMRAQLKLKLAYPVIEAVVKEDKYHPYRTIGPCTLTAKKAGWWSPETLKEDGQDQPTWMGIRYRHHTGNTKRPQTAGILDSTINPFEYPKTSTLLVNVNERTPRKPCSRQNSSGVKEVLHLPKSQSGRFEITAVPEERRESAVSNVVPNIELAQMNCTNPQVKFTV